VIVVTVARRPLAAHNVAANVLVHGAGPVNIDGCRVASAGGEVVGPGSWSNPSNRGGEVGGDLGFSGNDVARFQQAQAESVERANRLGRWPANLVLCHLPGCVREGTRKVRVGGDGVPRTVIRRSGVHAEAGGHQTVGSVMPVTSHADADGTETVASWRCVSGCPVADLDAQSGDVPTGSWVRHTDGAHPFGDAAGSPHERWRDVSEPAGGASRYFKQVGGGR
jgi:hypothetical protein